MASADNKRIAKNTFFLYFRMILLVIVSFYTTKIVLRELGIDDYGLYNVVASFVAMVAFINQTVTNSIQRFYNYALGKSESTLGEYMSASVFVVVCLAVFVLLLGESIGLWFVKYKINLPTGSEHAADVVYQTSLLIVLVRIIQAPLGALIIAKEKMQFYALLSIIDVISQLAVAFSLTFFSSNKLILYSWLLSAVSILVFIVNYIYARRLTAHSFFRICYDKGLIKEILSFSGWNLFGVTAGILKSQGINVLINLFFGVALNAARGISYQILSGISRLSTGFQVAINPQIIQSYSRGDLNRYYILCYTSFKLSLYLMWLIVLPCIILMPEILSIWLGNDVPKYTAIFTQIVLLTGLIDSQASAISTPLYATGNIKEYQIKVSLIIMTIIPLSWIAYKLGYDVTISLWISLIISVFAQVGRVKIWAKLTGAPVMKYIKEIVFPGTSIMLLSYAITYFARMFMGIPESDLVLVAVITTVSIAVNVALIYALGLKSYEKSQLKEIIKSKFDNKSK